MTNEYIKLTAKAQADFRNHVLSEFPKEACGLLVNGRYIKSQNVSDVPELMFKIDNKLLMKYDGKIQAVLHSHPYQLGTKQNWDPVWPSETDMANWMNGDIPWGIVSTDGEGISKIVWLDDNVIQPLLGREFVHGVTDCYAIIRDYFRLNKGITLMNGAREMNWWDAGADHYSKNFIEAGFVEIPRNEATIDDVALFQVRSPVVNHAAIISGPDEIIHHMFHRLSSVDSLRKWDKQIVRYIRYVGGNK